VWKHCRRRASRGTSSREPDLSVLSQPRQKPRCSALQRRSGICSSTRVVTRTDFRVLRRLREGGRGVHPSRQRSLKTKQDHCGLGTRETSLADTGIHQKTKINKQTNKNPHKKPPPKTTQPKKSQN